MLRNGRCVQDHYDKDNIVRVKEEWKKHLFRHLAVMGFNHCNKNYLLSVYFYFDFRNRNEDRYSNKDLDFGKIDV